MQTIFVILCIVVIVVGMAASSSRERKMTSDGALLVRHTSSVDDCVSQLESVFGAEHADAEVSARLLTRLKYCYNVHLRGELESRR